MKPESTAYGRRSNSAETQWSHTLPIQLLQIASLEIQCEFLQRALIIRSWCDIDIHPYPQHPGRSQKKIHFQASELISHSYSASHTYNLDIDILQRNRDAHRSQYYAGHYAEEARLSMAQNAKTRGLQPLPPLLLAAGSARDFIVAGLGCVTARGK